MITRLRRRRDAALIEVESSTLFGVTAKHDRAPSEFLSHASVARRVSRRAGWRPIGAKPTFVPDETREKRLAAAAELYDFAGEQLDKAAAHARRAGEHVRNGEVPRGTAHAWAALGHVKVAEDRLFQQARDHSERSSI